MSRAKVVTGLLVASLITNVYLLATRASGHSDLAARSSSGAAHGERRGERSAPSQGTPAPGRPASAPAKPASLDPGAREYEAALTAQLLKAQAELEEHRPLGERFQQAAERSPEIEEQARVELDKIFVTKPGQKPVYAIECHGAVCLLKVDDDQDRDVWMRSLQSSTRDVFRKMSFSVLYGTYVEVSSPEQLAASRYVQSVFDVIRSSPATTACKQQFPTPGNVVLRVVLGSAREVRVTMTGTLADKDLGVCLRPVLEQAPSQVPPPPANISSLPDSGMVVSVPRPDAPKSLDAPVERKLTREHLASKLAPPAN
jgi:hypothetical protein